MLGQHVLDRVRSDPARLHLVLMLGLTFSTGIIDAVGYLGLDRVFTGNMTGNVVILGMALTGAAGLHVVGPLSALLGFLAGAAAGGRLLRPVAEGWSRRTTAIFGAVGGLLLALAAALFAVGGRPGSPLQLVFTTGLGLVMGTQAATARHLAIRDVTTVVVTSTITAFASDSRLAGGRGQPWVRRLSAIVLISAGAAVGALLLDVHIGLGVAVSGVLTLTAALLGQVGAVVPPAPASAEHPDVAKHA